MLCYPNGTCCCDRWPETHDGKPANGDMKQRCFFIGTPLGDLSIMKQFEALGHELAKRGHKVIILAPHRKVEMARPNENPAVLIWPSERPTKLRDAWFFYKLVRQYKPDCV